MSYLTEKLSKFRSFDRQ